MTQATLNKKKAIYSLITRALSKKGQNASIEEFFRAIDTDLSGGVDPKEFTAALSRLSVDINEYQGREIFDTIDFDKDGTVSLEELAEDYHFVIRNPPETPQAYFQRVDGIRERAH